MANPISYSLYEAHKATEIPQRYIRDAVKRGELPAVRLGRNLVIRRESLDNWLQAYERRLNDAV
jgi:excisionase family DNA binding protein